MVILKLGQVVDVAVDDDVQVLRRLVGGDLRRGEDLRHGCGATGPIYALPSKLNVRIDDTLEEIP